MNNDLTFEYVTSRLSYDKTTGTLTWKHIPDIDRYARSWNARWAGRDAGSPDGHGYITVRISRRHYKAHRLAWLIETGEWPTDQIDHIDGDKSNDRIYNLRQATHSQNEHNTGKRKNNTSGFKGVSWNKRKRRWRATIVLDGRQRSLGYFHDPKDAHAAYCHAAPQLHGEFARIDAALADGG